jgi:hypothetical protein
MTSLSRRKRPTILRGRIRSAWTAISAGLRFALAAKRHIFRNIWASAKLQAALVAGLLFSRAASAQDIIIIDLPEPAPRPVQVQPAPSKVRTISFTKPAAAPVVKTVPVTFQPPMQPKGAAPLDESKIDFQVRIDLPGPDILFRRDSEAQVLERIRQESTRPGGQRVIFPERVPVSKEPFKDRDFPQTTTVVEQGNVAHRRLFFEQTNFDRQAWEIGYLQPGISGFRFFYDTVMMPYHCGTEPLRRWDASAGKCLPGDDTPLFCYREPFSVTGLTFQVFSVAGGILIFP